MTDPLAPAAARGLVLLGCGKMGGAMLEGWLAGGLPASAVSVIDPNAPADLAGRGVVVNAAPPASPAVVVLAVKPQTMDAALPTVAPLAGPETLFLSVAAGKTLAYFEAALGRSAPIVRAMPNTPAAVGRGITALIANAAGEAFLTFAEALLSAVGETVRLEAEAQMDAVTALSGGGPAYVFHLIEAMAAAGEAEGLSPDLAMRLARATVTGSGELARRSPETAEALRVAVTSPGGTTAEALKVLMDAETGLPPIMRRAVAAAAARSRALGG
ncbi:MAG: pyrroline-5-carboxylate reductase [Rhodobacteraceae bacterium]|nr:MAG: pyrroline-5-carboxylate reductase [Paracoccaceae bacterium]